MKGILGRKIGMTSVFTQDGRLIPVTVIVATPNVVTQIKTIDNDGYNAIQVAFLEKREKLVNKPAMGHFKKANTTPKRFLREIRGAETTNYNLGDEIKVDIFTEGEVIDVTGTSKGKGFQGNIKRHNQSRGPMSHGSQYHRGVGSMGTLLPMRVLPGKKLPGHMGNETVTIQNLEVIQVDLANNVILVSGNVPGANNTLVFIKPAVKKNGLVNKKTELHSYEEKIEIVEEEMTEESVSEEVSNEQVEITEEIVENEVEAETTEVTETEENTNDEAETSSQEA